MPWKGIKDGGYLSAGPKGKVRDLCGTYSLEEKKRKIKTDTCVSDSSLHVVGRISWILES